MEQIGENTTIPDTPFSFQWLLYGDDWQRWDTYPTVEANTISPDPTVEMNHDGPRIESCPPPMTLTREEMVQVVDQRLQSSTNEQSETASQEHKEVPSHEDTFTYERRSKINEKIKALQKLIPNSNKTDEASILDEAIEYLKQLQLQVQTLAVMNGLGRNPMRLPPVLPPTQTRINETLVQDLNRETLLAVHSLEPPQISQAMK